MDNNDRMMTPREVADLLGLSLQRLAQLRRAGTGPAYCKLSDGQGGSIRYRRAAVDAWIESRTRKAVSCHD